MGALADLFAVARIQLDKGSFEVDAVKMAGKAGTVAGTEASQTLGKSLKKGLSGIGTGLAQGMGQQMFRSMEGAISDVANAIPDLIARGQEYATTIHDIQELTNGTARDTSIFVGTLTALGIPVDGLSMKFGTLATQVQTNEKLFNKYGIAVRDSDGVMLDGITILDNTRAVLAKLSDATERDYVARKLLGRGGLEWLDFLKLSDPQVALLTSRLVAMGMVLSQDTVDAAKKAIYEQKQLDLAFTGLGVTLFTEVGPIIRTVMSGITQWIVDNGKTIRAVLATIVNAFAGLVAGITGADMSGLAAFSEKLFALGAPGSGRVGQLSDRLGELQSQMGANTKIIEGGTKATAANTDAIDANVASVDKQLAALDKKDSALEKAFQRDMVRQAAVYGAQLAQLDADEATLDAARAKQDLAIQLLAAQEDLRKSQSAGEGGTIDFKAEEEAHARILDIQAQQREATRVADVADRRQGLEAVKAYIESIAALEASSENKKALARNLATREKTLEGQLAAAKAAGDTVAAGRLASEIEAVKTAETRTQAAIRSGAQRTELEKTKADLAELKKSITASIGGGTSDAVTEAIAANKELEAEYQRVSDAIEALYMARALGKPGGGGGLPPLGASGGLATAMDPVVVEWTKRGKELVEILVGKDGVKGAIGTVGEAVISLGDELGKIVNWFTQNKGLLEILLVLSGNPMLIAAGLALAAASLNDPGTFSPIEDWLGLSNRPKPTGTKAGGGLVIETRPPKPSPDAVWVPAGPAGPGYWRIPGKAAGGLIPAGSSAMVGEAGYAENVRALPGGGAWVTAFSPTIAPQPAFAMAGMGPGSRPPIHTHVYLNGREIALAMDESLAMIRRP